MPVKTDPTIERRVDDVFAHAGVRGYLHAVEIGGGGPEVALRADEPVVLASVFKILIGVAFVRAVAEGRLDPRERTVIGERYRVGGIGTAGCHDDVTLSWRDAAEFMLTMSDNAATDVLYHRLGQEAVDQVVDELGLQRTRIMGCCEDLFGRIAAELGVDPLDLDAAIERAAPEQVRALSVLDPRRTDASTPRDITTLLAATWTDRAAPAAACQNLREIMGRQIWPHRLGAGFPDDVELAGKTGTLPGIHNEVGVVTWPDGRRFAVAVFTRSDEMALRAPATDAAIAAAARAAVDHLRAG
jgi:beta-lactamase class A